MYIIIYIYMCDMYVSISSYFESVKWNVQGEPLLPLFNQFSRAPSTKLGLPVPAMANEQILRAQNATYALLDSQAPVPDCCVHWRPGL